MNVAHIKSLAIQPTPFYFNFRATVCMGRVLSPYIVYDKTKNHEISSTILRLSVRVTIIRSNGMGMHRSDSQ